MLLGTACGALLAPASVDPALTSDSGVGSGLISDETPADVTDPVQPIGGAEDLPLS
jgi:hypothetical protein